MARYRVSKQTLVGWETDVPSGTIVTVPAPRKSQGATFWNHQVLRPDGTRVTRSVGMGTRALAEAAQQQGLLTFTTEEDPLDPAYDFLDVDFGPLKDCTASITEGKIALVKLTASPAAPAPANGF